MSSDAIKAAAAIDPASSSVARSRTQSSTQHQMTVNQFGAAASDYLTSPVHANGADLQRLREVAQAHPTAHILDLGCGAGHASFALAQYAAHVTAVDPSQDMIRTVADEAARRGLSNLHTTCSSAEQLSAGDNSIDIVVTRFSAHHWHNLGAALSAVHRVLKPGGVLIVIDITAPENALCDTALQTVEILRDVSHIRDYRESEWRAMLAQARFNVTDSDSWKLPMQFDTWVARSRTSEIRTAAIRDIWAHASCEVRDYFSVQQDDSFAIDATWLTSIKQ